MISLTHIWLFNLFDRPIGPPPDWKRDIILWNAERLTIEDTLRIVTDNSDYFNELFADSSCVCQVDVQDVRSYLNQLHYVAEDKVGAWLRRHIRNVCQLTDLLRLICCLRDQNTFYLDTDCRLLERPSVADLGPVGTACCLSSRGRPYLSAIACNGARAWAANLLQHELADLESGDWPWLCLILPGALGKVRLLPDGMICHHVNGTKLNIICTAGDS